MKVLPYDSKFYLDDFRNEIDENNLEESYYNFAKKFDLIITKHLDNRKVFILLRNATIKAGIPLIMDFDDNIYAVRKDQPAYEKGYGDGGIKRSYVSAAASFCNALFVSTQALKTAMQDGLKARFNIEMPVYVLPNFNTKEDWEFPNGKSKKNKITIGWAGSLTHDADLKMIIPVLEEVLLNHKNVEVELLGGIKERDIIEFFKNVNKDVLNQFIITAGTGAFNNYPKLFMSKRWDIGIAPLIVDDFNVCKSDIKWMENAMKKIPTVASKDTAYERIIDGETGYLCSTKEQWITTLTYLINNKEQREKIGKNAYEYVTKYLQYKDNKDKWIEAIEDVLKNHKKTPKTLQ